MNVKLESLLKLLNPVFKQPSAYGIFNAEFVKLFSKGLSVGLNIESTIIINEDLKLVKGLSSEIEISLNDYFDVIDAIKNNNRIYNISDVYRFNAFQVGYFFATLLTDEKGVDMLMYNKGYEKYLLNLWKLPVEISRPYFSIIQYISYNPHESLNLFFKTYEDYSIIDKSMSPIF